jgi:hypothetical protein
VIDHESWNVLKLVSDSDLPEALGKNISPTTWPQNLAASFDDSQMVPLYTRVW